MSDLIDPEFITPTPAIEAAHEAVKEFARRNAGAAGSEAERAVRLYYAVRDTIRYDPYRIDLSLEGMKASATLDSGRGWCVSKAVLLAACCRSLGIASRLGFADVRNHLSTEKLRERMRTDIFYWHGYTEMMLSGRWVKATPAFNIELCEKFGLLPLDFDGRNDSLYHAFDSAGNRHMEYINNRGSYSDLPLEEIIRTFGEEYGPPEGRVELGARSFDEDVARETR
ncbi:MAG TPA: transglutaminase family protein [Blastocatellia bacterium]|jgi:transglutaminase-like putative cysteine protease|nr:transglutaminase family protein [Blastocatellia bacterium]